MEVLKYLTQASSTSRPELPRRWLWEPLSFTCLNPKILVTTKVDILWTIVILP